MSSIIHHNHHTDYDETPSDITNDDVMQSSSSWRRMDKGIRLVVPIRRHPPITTTTWILLLSIDWSKYLFSFSNSSSLVVGVWWWWLLLLLLLCGRPNTTTKNTIDNNNDDDRINLCYVSNAYDVIHTLYTLSYQYDSMNMNMDVVVLQQQPYARQCFGVGSYSTVFGAWST